jgi:subtilisin family serine protease/peptidoglycan hydrolase-like protein with peptidoglycan-binding domain
MFDPALQELYAEGTPDDEVAVILRLSNPVAIPDGVRIVAQFGHIVTCRLKRGDIPRVRGQDLVQSMKAARYYSSTPIFTELSDGTVRDEMQEDVEVLVPRPTDQRRPEGDLPTGRGVIVAHIDWGVDFAHPDFRKPDGRTRLLALWDQSSPYDSQRPNPYGYGRIYFADEINRALASEDPYTALGYSPATSDSGSGSHGTHTLSISAGNGRKGSLKVLTEPLTQSLNSDNNFYSGPIGLAPEAHLVFVHLSTYTAEGPTELGDSVALLEGLDLISRIAALAGGTDSLTDTLLNRFDIRNRDIKPLPLVVNASLGRQAGEHDGRTLTEQGMDAFLLEVPGRAIVQSTGNYFNRQIHACGMLRPGESRTLRLIVDQGDRTPNEVDIWYAGVDRLRIILHGPDGTVKARARPGERVSLVVDGRDLGRLYHRIGDPNNGDNQVTLFLYRAAPLGEWELTLIGEDIVDGRFHAWIERDVSCPNCQARFALDDSEPTSTTGTICNGFRTLAVGAYDAHRENRPLGSFSSCGPTRDGRQKPDLVAPGVRVLAARSRSRSTGLNPFWLTRMSGTSMASPHVAGTIALMFEAANRPLSIEETRRLLLVNTDPPPEDASPEDRLRIGSGYLNTAAAVAEAKRIGSQLAKSNEAITSEQMLADSETVESNKAMQTIQEYQIELKKNNASTRYQSMSAYNDETESAKVGESSDMEQELVSLEVSEPMYESSDEADRYGLEESEDHDDEAAKDQSKYIRVHRQNQPGAFFPPFQVQVPLTGGSPALAVPLGDYRSPLAFTVPLGGTPPTVSPTSTPFVPASAQSGSSATSSQALTSAQSPLVAEPVISEPSVTQLLATDPPVAVAAQDTPLYVPPESEDEESLVHDEYYVQQDAITEKISQSPFQVQLPLTGGAPTLAVPLGGNTSPVAFTLPLSGGSPSALTAQASNDTPSFTIEPDTFGPPDSAEISDFYFYGPTARENTETEAEIMERPETWQEPSEYLDESQSDFGEQILAAAEVAMESDTPPVSSAALLALLLSGVNSSNPSEAENCANPLDPLDAKNPFPSATTLFNTFINPNHPLSSRHALHHHYSRRFQVLAHPGEPIADLSFRPGDLLLRIARGEGWGCVAVVAAPELHRHDHLGAIGLRGESYPRLRPGLYVQVVEIFPRRRRRDDRFARRFCDGSGLVLPDTLLLRPRPAHLWGTENDEAVPDFDILSERPSLLRRGSTGTAVREAQRKLNRIHVDAVALGFPGLAGCPLVEDSRFGERMEAAVRSLQQQVFSDPSEWNGVIDPKTWAQLDLLAGGKVSNQLSTPILGEQSFSEAIHQPVLTRAARMEWQDLSIVQGSDGQNHLYYLTTGGPEGVPAIFNLKISNTNKHYNFSNPVLKVRLSKKLSDGSLKTIPLRGQKGDYKIFRSQEIKDESSHVISIQIERQTLAEAYDANPISPLTRLDVEFHWTEGGTYARFASYHYNRHSLAFLLVKPFEFLFNEKQYVRRLGLNDQKYQQYWTGIWEKEFSASDNTPLTIASIIQTSVSESGTDEITMAQSTTETRGVQRGIENTYSTSTKASFGVGDAVKIGLEQQEALSTKTSLSWNESVARQFSEALRASRTYTQSFTKTLQVTAQISPAAPGRIKTLYVYPIFELYKVRLIRFEGPNRFGQATGRKVVDDVPILLFSHWGDKQVETDARTKPIHIEPTDSEFLAEVERLVESVDVNRDNPDYIRWLQSALNYVLGSHLAIDGVMGAKTRGVVRSFQQQSNLPIDGIVGPLTDAALRIALAGDRQIDHQRTAKLPPEPVCITLDNFPKGNETILPTHQPKLIAVARRILSESISNVNITGFASSEGTDIDNLALGQRRAERTTRELQATLERMRPGSSNNINFITTSRGESEQIAGGNLELNRRVTICLHIQPPPPSPSPSPSPSLSINVACPPPLMTPGATLPIPTQIEEIIRSVRRLLNRLPGVVPGFTLTGVVLPTAARFLDRAEQDEVNTVFRGSLNFTKILIANGLGFSGRPFTVAVQVSTDWFVVMLLGDLCSWATRPRSNTIVHELTHAWQSQHHGTDPRAYMLNSIRCQAGALADLPVAKSAASARAVATALRSGVIDSDRLADIGSAAFAAEDVSAYAYIPGRPMKEYAAEQVAQQVEDAYSAAAIPTPSTVTTILPVLAMNVRSVDNEASLKVLGFERSSTHGVIFH